MTNTKTVSIEGFKQFLQSKQSQADFVKGMESYGFFLDTKGDNDEK